MNTQKIKQWGPWALVFAAALAYHLTCLSREIGGNLGGDNVVYFLLGKALATGQGYVNLYLPGNPAHVKYPFLFPLLLAPFHLLFDRPLPWMHGAVILVNVTAAMLAGALFGRRFSSRWMGIILAGWFAMIPPIYRQSLNLLSEPLLMVLVFGALLASDEARATMTKSRFLAVALLAVGAWFTRSAGIALIVALAASYWVRQTKVKAGRFEVPAAPALIGLFVGLALLWILRNHLVSPEAAGYGSEFMAKDPYKPELGQIGAGDLVRRIINSFFHYTPYLGVNTIGPAWFANLRWLGWPLLILIVLGLGSQLAKGRLEAELYFIVSYGIVLVWPFHEYRFLIPLLPLSAFYLVAGLEWTAAKIGGEERIRRWVAPAAVVVLLIQAPTVINMLRLRMADGREPKGMVVMDGHPAWTKTVIDFANYDFDYGNPQMRGLIELNTDFLIINHAAADLTPPQAVLLSRKPMWTYYLSGRKCVPLFRDPNPLKQSEYLKSHQVDYVVLGLEEDPLLPLLNQWWSAEDDRFEVTAQIPRGRSALLKVNRNRL